jgi:hypothetical protein
MSDSHSGECPDCGAINDLKEVRFCYACATPLFTKCERGHDYPISAGRCPHCPPSAEEDRFRPAYHGTHRSAQGGVGAHTQVWDDERTLCGWLVVLRSASEPDYQYFPIHDGENVIGKPKPGSGVDVPLGDRSVSSRHALIWLEDDKYYLSDQRSSNGTRVNGEVLDPRIPRLLEDDDLIDVGRTTLAFKSYRNPFDVD